MAADLGWATAKPRTCRRHDWIVRGAPGEVTIDIGTGESFRDARVECFRCGRIKDPAISRRGRSNRSRGNRAELTIARLYGGEKTGPLGGPEDIRGAMFKVQVKTRQTKPPVAWKAVFAALDSQSDGRTPVLLIRYLPGRGIAAEDFFIVRGRDWLALHGKDR